MSKLKWYTGGLNFKCTECGACCTGAPGHVFVTQEEIQKIAAHLNLSIQDFTDQYLIKVGDRFSLREKPKNFDCVFLNGKKCTIYSIRPVQCQTFPWWPTTVDTKTSWQETANYCEGISPLAPLVSEEHIEKEKQRKIALDQSV